MKSKERKHLLYVINSIWQVNVIKIPPLEGQICVTKMYIPLLYLAILKILRKTELFRAE